MADLPRLSATRVRLAGRAPRLALFGTCGVLAAAGAAGFVRSPTGERVIAANRAPDLTAEVGLAERFAREYLTLKPGGEAGRTRRLTQLGLADTALAADHVGSSAREVVTTSIAGVGHQRGEVTTVTVAVFDGHSWTFLAVPVQTDHGRMSIASNPAVVGPPPVAHDSLSSPEDEVQQRALKQMLERVLRHYLAGDAPDLIADLAPGTNPTLPATALRVVDVQAVTWVQPGRTAAVAVTARASSGLQLSLRYELSVVRRAGRWLVTAFASHTETKESTR